MRHTLPLFLLLLPMSMTAQNVGIGTTTPNASAQLEISSTTKGILVPRMTQAQRTAISNPAQGLLVYQTDGVVGFYLNRSSIPAAPNWSAITEGTNQWIPGVTANSIYNLNTGNVGVGTNAPNYPFTVQTGGIGIAQQSPDGSTQIGFYTTNGNAYVQTHSNHDMNFSTNNGTPQLTLKTTGNFGVGNSNPTNKLDVSGTFRATGNAVIGGTIQIQGGSPAAGRVLTSDASGQASWEPLPSASSFQNLKEISLGGTTNWTVPAGVTKIWVEVWGSGGDGSSNTFPEVGGGGGAGAYASFFVTVTPGSTATVNITSGTGNYTQFSYSGDFVRAFNGEDAFPGNGGGRGGIVIRGALNFSLNMFYSGGQDGENSTYLVSESNVGTKTVFYRGGNGGDAYKGRGGKGEVWAVPSGSAMSAGTNRGFAGTPVGFGSGGGARTNFGGSPPVQGTQGAVLIYY
ncbi:MAG: hypothetical protein NTW29_15860 [Bacteroidetes bacterium]|nr:hypothetical protein [Bacteroidota bacterium]